MFVPLFAHADGETVIGSSESLKERNLPLVYELMDETYRKSVLKEGCINKISIFEEFVNGGVNIPFSAEDLLKVCKKSIKIGGNFWDGGFSEISGHQCKVKACAHFVINYIKSIPEYQFSGVISFDEEVFKNVLTKKYAFCDTELFLREIRKYKLDGHGDREDFGISELRTLCEKKSSCSDNCVDIVYDYVTEMKAYAKSQKEMMNMQEKFGFSPEAFSGSTACLQANNFQPGMSFHDCGHYVNVGQGYSESETESTKHGQCKRWYELAKQCQVHLLAVYTEKLDYLQTKREIEQYRCVINKIQTGQMYFPFDEAELLKSCE
jgi:hypothetical protein